MNYSKDLLPQCYRVMVVSVVLEYVYVGGGDLGGSHLYYTSRRFRNDRYRSHLLLASLKENVLPANDL